MVKPVDAIVIGASAGGVEALGALFSSLPHPLSVPVLVVLHVPPHGSIILDAFGKNNLSSIKEAEDKDLLEPGIIYFAPPGYHLLIEKDRTLSFTVEEPVQFSRPSIDVLFESAAAVFGNHLAGILLTGSNEDGAQGLLAIHKQGGLTIVQEPKDAPYKAMPKAALKLFKPDMTLRVDEMGNVLAGLKPSLPNTLEAPP